MTERSLHATEARPAGYNALIARFRLEVIPYWHESFVATGNSRRADTTGGGVTKEVYPARYWPGDTLGDHPEFALEYDGTNLAILAGVFWVAPQEELREYIESKPRGKYARRLWFLYELLTESVLPVEDLHTGGYIDLLDPGECYTTETARRVRRQRINDNLPGDGRFCPMVRRTASLRAFEEADLPARCRKIVARYSPELLKRAMSYLYTKETKSSSRDRAHQAHLDANGTLYCAASTRGKRGFLREGAADRPAESHRRFTVSGSRLPHSSELRRGSGFLAESEGPFRQSEARRLERTYGRADRIP